MGIFAPVLNQDRYVTDADLLCKPGTFWHDEEAKRAARLISALMKGAIVRRKLDPLDTVCALMIQRTIEDGMPGIRTDSVVCGRLIAYVVSSELVLVDRFGHEPHIAVKVAATFRGRFLASQDYESYLVKFVCYATEPGTGE